MSKHLPSHHDQMVEDQRLLSHKGHDPYYKQEQYQDQQPYVVDPYQNLHQKRHPTAGSHRMDPVPKDGQPRSDDPFTHNPGHPGHQNPHASHHDQAASKQSRRHGKRQKSPSPEQRQTLKQMPPEYMGHLVQQHPVDPSSRVSKKGYPEDFPQTEEAYDPYRQPHYEDFEQRPTIEDPAQFQPDKKKKRKMQNQQDQDDSNFNDTDEEIPGSRASRANDARHHESLKVSKEVHREAHARDLQSEIVKLEVESRLRNGQDLDQHAGQAKERLPPQQKESQSKINYRNAMKARERRSRQQFEDPDQFPEAPVQQRFEVQETPASQHSERRHHYQRQEDPRRVQSHEQYNPSYEQQPELPQRAQSHYQNAPPTRYPEPVYPQQPQYAEAPHYAPPQHHDYPYHQATGNIVDRLPMEPHPTMPHRRTEVPHSKEPKYYQSSSHIPNERDDTPEATPRTELRKTVEAYTGEKMAPHHANHDPRLKKPVKQENINHLQQAISHDYEQKMQAVNEEAIEKLKHVQAEHKRVIEKTQALYIRSKEGSREIEAERNSKAVNDKSFQTQNLSFLDGSMKPKKREQSQSRGGRGRSRSGSRGRHDRDTSRTTIQMLNDSRGSQGFIEDILDTSNFSQVPALEKDPKKLRAFYKEYCQVILNRKRPAASGQRGEEVNLHDVLLDLGFLSKRVSSTVDPKFQATSSDMVELQKSKFMIPIKSEFKYFTGEPTEDIIRNLFKVLCGILNMRLSQRGQNPLEERVLISFLDAINPEILDNDLIVMNQLATIKQLINRKAFSVSDRQIGEIHKKFMNMCEQRKLGYEPISNDQFKSSQPPKDEFIQYRPSAQADDWTQSRSSVKTVGARQGSDIKRLPSSERKVSVHRLPRELEQHELEESREFRRNMADRRQQQRKKQSRSRSRVKSRSSLSGTRNSANDSRHESMIGKGSRYASPARQQKPEVTAQSVASPQYFNPDKHFTEQKRTRPLDQESNYSQKYQADMPRPSAATYQPNYGAQQPALYQPYETKKEQPTAGGQGTNIQDFLNQGPELQKKKRSRRPGSKTRGNDSSLSFN